MGRAQALLWLVASLSAASCVIDLSNLTSGGAGGSGGDGGASASQSSSSSSAPSSSSSGGCSEALLACTCACDGGTCPVTDLAAGPPDADGPAGIAVTADAVYWVNTAGGTVMRRTPGNAPEVLASAASPVDVAADGTLLAWVARDGIFTCDATSCGATQTMLAPTIAMGSGRRVIVEAPYVYWTDAGTAPEATDGKVRRATTSGSPEDLAVTQVSPDGIAIAGSALFWTVRGTGQDNGTVHKAAKDGSNLQDIATARVSPSSLAADAMYVYWVEVKPGGGLLRCPHTNGYCQSPTTLATAALPVDVALGGGRVVWADQNSQTILSCPAGGCSGAPLVHASGRAGIDRITLRSGCLFWTDDNAGGTVAKARSLP